MSIAKLKKEIIPENLFKDLVVVQKLSENSRDNKFLSAFVYNIVLLNMLNFLSLLSDREFQVSFHVACPKLKTF